MKVLVACEYSGRVRDAFTAKGHDAISCDLLETEVPGKHYKGDIKDIIYDGFDLMIAHPPCTHLAVSGSRHFWRKEKEQKEALDFVRFLMDAPIKRWCLENPVSIISSRISPSDQPIPPYMFGHGETKATCFWLKNLPLLKPTKYVEGREPKVWLEPPGPDRWKNRSRTYQGIADAMAEQWGDESKLPTPVEQLTLFS